MSVKTIERPTDRGADHDTPRMIHWCVYPFTHGLCGAVLKGKDHPDAETVDCVVCAEIAGTDR